METSTSVVVTFCAEKWLILPTAVVIFVSWEIVAWMNVFIFEGQKSLFEILSGDGVFVRHARYGCLIVGDTVYCFETKRVMTVQRVVMPAYQVVPVWWCHGQCTIFYAREASGDVWDFYWDAWAKALFLEMTLFWMEPKPWKKGLKGEKSQWCWLSWHDIVRRLVLSGRDKHRSGIASILQKRSGDRWKDGQNWRQRR